VKSLEATVEISTLSLP